MNFRSLCILTRGTFFLELLPKIHFLCVKTAEGENDYSFWNYFVTLASGYTLSAVGAVHDI